MKYYLFFIVLFFSNILYTAESEEIEKLKYELYYLENSETDDIEIPDSLKLNYLERLSNYYLNHSPEQSLLYDRKRLVIYKSRNQLKDISYIMNRMAETNKRLTNYKIALDLYYELMEIGEASNDKKIIANAYNNIGNIHWSLAEEDVAFEFIEKSIELSKESGDKIGLSHSYNSLASIYYVSQKYEMALDYCLKALDLSKETGDDGNIVYSINNLGLIYKKLHKYDEALESYKQSLQLKKDLGYTHGVAISYLNIGSLYYTLENYEDAISYTNLALDTAKKLNAKNVIVSAYNILYTIFQEKDDYKNAYLYLEKYSSVRDSIFSKENMDYVHNMEANFKIESKEKELQIEKRNIKIKDYQIKKQKFIRNAFLFILLLLLIFLMIIVDYYFSKHKSHKLLQKSHDELKLFNTQIEKKNSELIKLNKQLSESESKLLDLNKTKDKFFTIIAHDLKNPIFAFSAVTALMMNLDFESNKEEYYNFTKVIHESALKFQSLTNNLLQWARSQTGSIKLTFAVVNLFDLTKDILDNLRLVASQKKISISNNLLEDLHVYVDENMIKTVIFNIITNSIKFTDLHGNIVISSQKVDDYIHVSIRDNGMGMDEVVKKKIFKVDQTYSTKGTANESGTGLGLIICKEFIIKNGGDIWVESKKGEGSEFIFSLPALEKTIDI